VNRYSKNAAIATPFRQSTAPNHVRMMVYAMKTAQYVRTMSASRAKLDCMGLYVRRFARKDVEVRDATGKPEVVSRVSECCIL